MGAANQEENYSLVGSAITSVDQETDLGVVITADLKSSTQSKAAEQKAQKILGYIKRVFRYRNKQTVLALYRALVRPLLEYGAHWSPIRRVDVERLEKVQARATKLVPLIRHKGYQRRLADIAIDAICCPIRVMYKSSSSIEKLWFLHWKIKGGYIFSLVDTLVRFPVEHP